MMQMAFDLAPRARHSDPMTSHEAAHKARAFAGTHDEKILAYLKRIYPHSAHAEQIGQATGLTMVQVDRRRAGLIETNKIVITGTGTLTNGNNAGLWRRA